MDGKQEPFKNARPLTILFFPLPVCGPTNQCIGMADVLRRRGHRAVIVADSTWRGKIAAVGVEEYIIDLVDPVKKDPHQDPGEFWAARVRDSIPKFRQSPIIQLETFMKPTWEAVVDEAKLYERHVRAIIDHIRPDVIIQDHVVCIPAFVTGDVPFVRVVSCNPLEMPGVDIPPCFSGLPQNDRSDWESFRIEYDRLHRTIWEEFNVWVQLQGAPPLLDLQFNHESKHANIYIYPQEADYVAKRSLGPKWHRIDSSVRETDDHYELPAAIRDRPSDCNLVYLSLGTLGCADIELMQRLIDVLSHTRHRFIVSKGPMGHHLKLPDSMVGEMTLPQTKVIPLVDLVITHGGNNTVTEALHFGKPMILLPLFLDQHDNAQRMHEMGFGLRMNAYGFADEDLLAAVDKLLNDTSLRDRMTRLGEKIRERDGLRSGADIIQRVGRAYADRIA